MRGSSSALCARVAAAGVLSACALAPMSLRAQVTLPPLSVIGDGEVDAGQHVPASVTVLPRATLDDAGIDTVQDLARYVPNLFLSDGSVFPTEGAANPALIIMALADRLARLMRDKRTAIG